MKHLKGLTILGFGLLLVVGCGGASGDDWPGLNTMGGGKGDGVGTTHQLDDQTTESVTVPLGGSHSGVTAVVGSSDTHVSVQSAEILFTHDTFSNVEIVLEADDHVSFVIEARQQGQRQWQRIAVGPYSARAGGTLPSRETTLFRKVLLVPVSGELWGEAILAGGGWNEDDYMFGVSSMVSESITEYRIFVTPDWDFMDWNVGDARSYTVRIGDTNKQRYLW